MEERHRPQTQIPQLLQADHGDPGRLESPEHNDRTRTACVRTYRLTLPLGKGRIPSPPRSMQQRFSEAVRLSPVPTSLPPSCAALEPRPLPSADITRLPRYYGPLRHPLRPDLTLAGCRLARATPPAGLPVLRPFPSSMRAAATTPAEPAGACVARYPAAGSLPCISGGSASTLPVSRPARRSLALRPAWSLSRLRGPLPSECFGRYRYLHHPLRLLPAGATVAGRDSHPMGSGAFARRTEKSGLRSRINEAHPRPGAPPH